MKKLRQEIIVYSIIFITISLLMHLDKWFSTPIEHLSALASHPLPYHPFLYVFLVYLLLYIIRVIFGFTKKLIFK